MPTITAETTEQIVSHALDDLRAQFQRALSGEGESGTTFFALGTKLYVDQSRRIAVNAGWPDLWTVRDGKRCVSTATALDQATLAMFVGADRFLTAAALFMILADIIAGKRQRAPETAIATFVNLAAVEPYFYPQRDLAIHDPAHRTFAGHRRRSLAAQLAHPHRPHVADARATR